MTAEKDEINKRRREWCKNNSDKVKEYYQASTRHVVVSWYVTLGFIVVERNADNPLVLIARSQSRDSDKDGYHIEVDVNATALTMLRISRIGKGHMT